MIDFSHYYVVIFSVSTVFANFGITKYIYPSISLSVVGNLPIAELMKVLFFFRQNVATQNQIYNLEFYNIL